MQQLMCKYNLASRSQRLFTNNKHTDVRVDRTLQ